MRRVILALLTLLIATPLSALPQETARIFSGDKSSGEGRMWLSWSQAQRRGFVLGYVWGLEQGVRNGCLAFDAANPSQNKFDLSQKPDLLNNPLQQCLSQQPGFSKEPQYYEGQITKFYETYPRDVDLPIKELFGQLADSSKKTLEEIHVWFRTPAQP